MADRTMARLIRKKGEKKKKGEKRAQKKFALFFLFEKKGRLTKINGRLKGVKKKTSFEKKNSKINHDFFYFFLKKIGALKKSRPQKKKWFQKKNKKGGKRAEKKNRPLKKKGRRKKKKKGLPFYLVNQKSGALLPNKPNHGTHLSSRQPKIVCKTRGKKI